jgi:hypothetical protein
MNETMKETDNKQVERPAKKKKAYRKAVLKRLGKLRSVTGSLPEAPGWTHN